MYAVVAIGGKQYVVKKGDRLEVEKQEVEAGKEITLDSVLLAADGARVVVGTPLVSGCRVTAKVLAPTKGPKVISFKYRRRKATHWTKGHRQQLSVLEIAEIVVGK